MSKRIVTSPLILALLAALSAAACSGESPVASSPSPAVASNQGARVPSAPGVYDLTFNVLQNGTYQEVSSLPVKSQELILKAYVTDGAGAPAQKGSVTFEYCSYRKGPANDINRPDEAPLEKCADGTAAWARLDSISVTAGRCPGLGNGYACVNFGIVQIPRDVGFRIRYEPQGSGIPAGTTAPENFTWVAGS